MNIKFLKDYENAKAGDIAEVEDLVKAKGLVASGYAEEYVEEPQHVIADVDGEAIGNAVAKALKEIMGTTKVETVEEAGPHFKHLGEACRAIYKGTIKEMNITDDDNGGYATTELVDQDLMADILAPSGVVGAVRTINLNGTNNVYKFNILSSTGTAPAIVAEGAAISDSEPTLTQFSLTPAKLAYLLYASEESLQDTGALLSEIQDWVPQEFRKVLEDSVINGTLASFTGIVGHAQTVTVAKEAGQANATIVSENVDKMYSALKNPAQSMWVMSRTAYSAIQGLEDTNGNNLFVGPNAYSETPFGTLKGLKITISDYCKSIGTVGDIIVGDFSKYRIAVKGGLSVAQSDHIKFEEGATAFRWLLRAAGTPVGILQTATDSSEIGDFVELQSRAS